MGRWRNEESNPAHTSTNTFSALRCLSRPGVCGSLGQTALADSPCLGPLPSDLPADNATASHKSISSDPLTPLPLANRWYTGWVM